VSIRIFVGAVSILAIAASAGAQNASPDYSALGKGSVTIDLRQGAGGAFQVSVTAELDDVAGIVLREPSVGRELVRITAAGMSGVVGDAVASGKDGAKIEASDLRGRFSTKLAGDITHVQALEALLVRTDGTVYPLGVHTRTTVANTKVQFAFAATNCVTIKVTCGTCTAEETCCGARKDYCIDCIKCGIACPPCVMLP
jgi:hypothetical protein